MRHLVPRLLVFFLLQYAVSHAHDRRIDFDLGLSAGLSSGPKLTNENPEDNFLPDLTAGVSLNLLTPIGSKFDYSQSQFVLGLGVGYDRSGSAKKKPILVESQHGYYGSYWRNAYIPISLTLRLSKKGRYLEGGWEYYTFRTEHEETRYPVDSFGQPMQGPYTVVKVHNWGDGQGFTITIGIEQTKSSRVKLGISLTARMESGQDRGNDVSLPARWSSPVPVDFDGVFLSLHFKPNFL